MAGTSGAKTALRAFCPAMTKKKLVQYAQTACESAVSGFDGGPRGDYVMRS
jgi:hypothetical protein